MAISKPDFFAAILNATCYPLRHATWLMIQLLFALFVCACQCQSLYTPSDGWMVVWGLQVDLRCHPYLYTWVCAEEWLSQLFFCQLV